MANKHGRIGPNIHRLRRGKGWSKRELARRIGAHHSTITNWESSATVPDHDMLLELVRHLGKEVLAPLEFRTNHSKLLVPHLDEIRDMAADAVIAAGGTAMRFFEQLPREEQAVGRERNPKLLGDAAANSAMLKSVVLDARSIGRRVGSKVVVFGEELAADSDSAFGELVQRSLDKLPDDDACTLARSNERFAALLAGEGEDEDGPRLGVIGDPTDGSGNLELGLGGQFVSAIAILDGSALLASAIYDPYGGVLFTAVYHPDAHDYEHNGVATMRHLRAGVSTELEHKAKFGRRVLSFHASRSSKPMRRAMLDQLDGMMSAPFEVGSSDVLDRTMFPGGITAINCGHGALACVAARRYASFTSATTSIWDLAAGDLLLGCSGGMLTDFDGLPIDYGAGIEKSSVIATWNHDLHGALVRKLHRVRDRS